MESEASGFSQPISQAASSGAAMIARPDRIPIWSLSYLFIGIIGFNLFVPAPGRGLSLMASRCFFS